MPIVAGGMTALEATRGCLLGALVGDAAGASLELMNGKPDRDDVKRALGMSGGGYWRTAQGQIADANACIVGGLAGALNGESDMPSALTAAVMGCDTGKGRPRPEWLQTRVQLPRLMDALLSRE